jgi:hypothetical protein
MEGSAAAGFREFANNDDVVAMYSATNKQMFFIVYIQTTHGIWLSRRLNNYYLIYWHSVKIIYQQTKPNTFVVCFQNDACRNENNNNSFNNMIRYLTVTTYPIYQFKLIFLKICQKVKKKKLEAQN